MKMKLSWREWCALPEIGIQKVHAKIDTGAKTSSLDAQNIKCHEKEGITWVSFLTVGGIHVECPLLETRMITTSGRHTEERFIIRTKLFLGHQSWDIDLSLANREGLTFRLLLGRDAIQGRALIEF